MSKLTPEQQERQRQAMRDWHARQSPADKQRVNARRELTNKKKHGRLHGGLLDYKPINIDDELPDD